MSFLAALLRAARRQKEESAPGLNPPVPTPSSLNPPVPTPAALNPPGETGKDDDWLFDAGAEPPAEYFADYPRGEVDGFMRFGQWLDCSKSTNVQAVQYLPDEKHLNVIYHSGVCWTYGDISHEEAYALATAVAQGITACGNVSTSGKGVFIWDAIRVRGKGHRHDHQKPAWINSALSGSLPKWMATEESRREHGRRAKGP